MIIDTIDIPFCKPVYMLNVALFLFRYLKVSRKHQPNPLLDTKAKWRIAVMLTLVWSVPMFYVSLPYLGWHDTQWETRNRAHKCVGNRLLGYRLVGLLITFYIPVLILVIFHYLIYQASQSFKGTVKTDLANEERI